MTFDDAITEYLAARRHREQDSERDRYTLKHLRSHFAGKRLAGLKRVQIRTYITARLDAGVKISTVRRELRLFCAAINFVRVEHDLHDLPNPVARLRLAKSEPRVRWITREQAAKLVKEAEHDAPRPHLAMFIRLALNTGCRRGELLDLEWSRVDLERGCFLLEARHTKGRRRRLVPLNAEAIKALGTLAGWQGEKGLQTPWVFGWERGKITTFKTAWTSALKRAGIENFRIHDLRHTFASWLVMQGESIYVVKELLGHACITQTEIYAHLAPSQGAAAVQRLAPF